MTPPDDNVHPLRSELENAPTVARPKGDGPKGDGGNGKGKVRAREPGEIWPDCPVQALGMSGDVSYYLDVRGQLRGVDNHTLQKMLHVFGGRTGLLSKHFPVYDKEGLPRPNRFDQMALSTAMITACEERGIWTPTGRMREAGCWTDDDGRLIVHAGDQVLIGGAWRPPGIYGGKVYAACNPAPRPADSDRQALAGLELLDLVETWNWRRRDIDPVLALGMICAQMLGGALEWRPVGWLTGDAATGKSTFQKLLLYIHGGETGLLQAADATEAGIRSVIGFSSLPVAIDELEPNPEQPSKTKNVVELARRASSGAQIFRGGADQKGHQSNAYSCFLFSSILVPAMPPQDRSRLILLDLDRLPPDTPKMALDPRRLRAIGAGLRRRLIDRWPEFQVRLETWRAALAMQGQTGRGSDNYGTCLALADMALHHAAPSAEILESWASKLSLAVTEDTTEIGSNAEDMLVHLMSQEIDVWRRGERFTVGQWVAMAAHLPGSRKAIDSADRSTANDYLARYGLRVYGRNRDAQLALANKPLRGLLDLFEGSIWADGVWSQAVRRIDGAEPVNMTLNRVATRGVRIPLKAIPGMLSFPMDRVPRDGGLPPPIPDEEDGFA